METEKPSLEATDAKAFTSLASFSRAQDVLAFVDRDARITMLSRGLGDTSVDDAVGHPLASLVHPAHADEVSQAITCTLRDGRPVTLDVPVRLRAGGVVWYQFGFSSLPTSEDCVALIACDVTARKTNEDRLKRAEALMTDTQGTAHLGTWEWDPREPNATWSDELYRIYGLTPEVYTPSYEGYLQLVHPDDRAHVIAATEGVFQRHEAYSHDERIMRPDGSMRYLHTWAHAVVDDAGNLVRLIGVCQDITDRKMVEMELEDRARELAHSNEALRREISERTRVENLLARAQKLEALGRLTGGIAHDFNNVLSVIVGYASLLYRRAPADSQERNYLTEILGSVERAGRMTSQLLAFSRDSSLQREALPLDSTIDDLAKLIRRLIGERVELTLDLHEQRRAREELPLLADANRSQFEQLVMNLAVNARDAMPEGGTLTISTRPTTLAEPSGELGAGEYITLTVTDTGTGMSDEVQAHMFDPFFTTKEHGQGTGLGLSTVYAIVKQNRGAISVVSALGKGSRFEITLPRAVAGKEVRRSDTQGVSGGTETILLVEDDASVRDMVHALLLSLGYQVIVAATPPEALRLAREHAGTIDLLVTDVVMPKMGGRELASKLVELRPRLRVIYMSGYTADVVLQEGVEEGRVMMISKPFLPTDLAAKLREVLDAAR